MNEYTTDVRDLDNLFLETIGGDDYYEVRQIVRRANGVRSVIGRASDWPMIRVCAQLADRTALLIASERRSVDADCHVVELLTRLSAYAEHIAALEAALAEATLITDPEAETAEQAFVERVEIVKDGKVPCDECDARVWPRGLTNHKRLKHRASAPDVAATPVHIREALELPESPWRCELCHEHTHARSLQQPALCIRCVVEAVDHANGNGHQVAA